MPLLDARFSDLFFCQNLYTLQRGLLAIAGLLVKCNCNCNVVTSYWLTCYYLNITSLTLQVSESRNTTGNNRCSNDEVSDGNVYWAIFILSMVLQGVGALPLYVLGVTYLDDASPHGTASVHIGKIRVVLVNPIYYLHAGDTLAFVIIVISTLRLAMYCTCRVIRTQCRTPLYNEVNYDKKNKVK